MSEETDRFRVSICFNVFKVGVGYSTKSFDSKEYGSEEEAWEMYQNVVEAYKMLLGRVEEDEPVG